MGLLKTLGFITKSATPVGAAQPSSGDIAQRRLQLMHEIAMPYVANANWVTLFNTVPEVAWPVNYIASRAAGARYLLKKYSDDTVVWDNDFANTLLVRPNAFESWYRTVWKHFAYKLVTGNSFIKAAMSDAFAGATTLWKWCDRYVTLEAPYVTIDYKQPMGDMYGVSDLDDVVRCYYHDYGQFTRKPIDPHCVFNDADDTLGFYEGDPLKAKSRLCSVLKAISNIIAVYEARNVIYVKRGGLGWLVSETTDEMGTRAMTPAEKRQVLDEADKMYGFGQGKYPYGISDVKLSFVRTNLSISDLQPFDETLADAVAIAGAYGIPPVLIPRKDQSTYSNQANAEKAVYSSVIIPLVQRFCQEFTHFLGLDQDGLYLDADFSDVDCLQTGKKEEQEVHRSITDRCKIEFESGLITLNDWRSQQGYEQVENPLYDKLVTEMGPDEIERVKLFTNPNRNNKMKEIYQRLQYKTKANDVDEAKGIVTVAVNGIGIVDSQNDISMPGSFNKTLSENIGRMKWFLNHDTTQLLGVPLEGAEKDGNLVMVGQLNLAKQIGRDTLEDYKLYASAGRTLEHSIGVQAVKRDKEDKRKVLEWKMWEYSTLTSWGSNPQTFLVGIKNDNPGDVRANIEFIRSALKMRYTDERLKQYEMRLDMLTKALEGAVVVTCPHCGQEFVWDDAERHTFDQQVLDAANCYLRWLSEGIVREEMNKLKPEIRAAVLAILSPVLSKCDGGIDTEMVTKSLTDLAEYAYCPNCYSRVYNSSIMLEQSAPVSEKTEDEPSEDTRDESEEEEEEKAAGGTFFGSLNAVIDKH